MMNHRVAARLFGTFFIITFLAYGTGSGLIDSVLNVPDVLANVYAHKTQIIVGAILMAVVHTFTNIGLASIMLPIVKPYNKALAYGYFSAAIAATTILVVGATFLLMFLPLSDAFVKAGSVMTPALGAISAILKMGGVYSYQIGMAIWGLGGLALCTLFYISRLIPRFITWWGFVGYLVFFTGTILELFGYPVGMLLSLPGGLFEIVLSFWLIFKGFSARAVVPKTA
ncbi:DUF4386 domain-containing protein [bacterium]|nr:DUF4386 domain-containing protein [bacterium]